MNDNRFILDSSISALDAYLDIGSYLDWIAKAGDMIWLR